MIKQFMESGLPLVLTVLPMAILANNLLGAALAKVDITKAFDWSKLRRGLLKGAMVYLSIFVYSWISFSMKDMTLDVLGGTYSLVDAMYIIVLATIIKYSKDGIVKLMEILQYKEDDVLDELVKRNTTLKEEPYVVIDEVLADNVVKEDLLPTEALNEVIVEIKNDDSEGIGVDSVQSEFFEKGVE